MLQLTSGYSLNKRIIYVTGLPRAGSTLLCQILRHHPEIYCPGHSSPLCPTVMSLRYNLSDNDFWLAQLDVDFEQSYQRLLNAFRGFINGWFAETDKTWVVDKNRGWLQHIETINHLDPNFKMLVCVRELGQIYGSIEAQHQKTLLLDFPDHLANLSRYDRADNLLGKNGVIGAPLNGIEALQDISPELQQRLFYVVFEHLMNEPSIVIQNIFQWLGVSPIKLDWQNLTVSPHESDSHYRYKYRHQTYSALRLPQKHSIPQRIQHDLQKNFTWFYQTFYPGLL
ncbi:sulfotransferase [Synechocystis sp. LEGE 06083]|nr:sulfotransferase [Synechocystis sp. LEGE 06083]